jgi:outer membrane protein assembly factor BamD (BamD/ComL family)
MKRHFQILPVLATALIVSACATGTVVIPDNLSPAELIQRAQEASDKNKYSVALQYYEALRERNSTNSDLLCTAEYEIAFIHYKQKKYMLAKEELNALLERYRAPDGEYLPPQFSLLAKKVLEQIEEKEKPRLKKKAKS